jgi:type I restriction enzyme S subunit
MLFRRKKTGEEGGRPVKSTVDLAVAQAGEVIAKTERLKKGLMQKLLTEGIGRKELKDTEIGKIPKEWDVVKLGTVVTELIGGGTPSTSKPEYWNGEIPWMTSAHIDGRLIVTGQRYITKKGVGNSATNIVPKDNLLVATRVGIGKVALNMIDIAISQDLTGVVIDRNKILPEFLYWFISSNERRLKSLAQGSTIKGVLREDLGKMLIPYPSIPEQGRIAEILTTIDKKAEIEEEEKASLERVKRGLMDLLLTGKVRIKVD